MAVLIVETAIRCAMAHLQARLNAEIAYVKLEAQLGLDLPAVTAWRGYDAGVATPDVVEAEVFDRSEVTFPNDAYDKSNIQIWNGGRARIHSLIPLRAAINHANRGNADAGEMTLTASQMKSRSDLYGAALTRIFRNDPTCARVGLVAFPIALRASVRDERIGDTVRTAARVEFDFDVSLWESSDGETVAGGAQLPAVTLETP